MANQKDRAAHRRRIKNKRDINRELWGSEEARDLWRQKIQITGRPSAHLITLWDAFVDCITLETLQEYKDFRAMLSSFITWCVVTGRLEFHG